MTVQITDDMSGMKTAKLAVVSSAMAKNEMILGYDWTEEYMPTCDWTNSSWA